MDKIVWDDATFSVGHEMMDCHHKTLVEMVNLLTELSAQTSVEQQEYHTLLGRLVEYVDQHFDIEENLLRSMNYPDIGEEHRAHEEYRLKIRQFSKDPDVDQLPLVLNFLREWLTNHILMDDMKYKRYMQQK